MKRGFKKELLKKGIVSAILLSLQLNTVAYAATVVVPDATQGKNPAVLDAANGTKIVNVRTPNNNGLSHNQYLDLQVGNAGIIFNNSAKESNTQLAGYIAGNQYLNGNFAKVILNEVTGNLPTALDGYLEIAGNGADLILANPNGILSNNTGFINTTRATLVAGKPELDFLGNLNGFNITNGEIAINDQGLDGSSATRVDLYANAVKINAGLWGNDVHVITGSNKINYETESIETLDNTAQGISLDVAALGGMYANKIMLVGTRKGVGVNMEGTLNAYTDGITLTQEGKIVVKDKVHANKNVDVSTNSGFENTGEIVAKENLNLNANGAVKNTGLLGAENNLTLNTTGEVRNEGSVLANNNLSLTSDTIINNSEIISGKELNITTNNLNNSNKINGDKVRLVVSNNLTNTGLINAEETNIKTNVLNNVETGRIYGTQVNIDARALNNLAGSSAPVIAARENMNLGVGDLVNIEHGLISAEKDMNIGGNIDASGNVVGQANSIVNKSATIESGENMTINAKSILNKNEHFATEEQLVKTEENIVEYQGSGSPFKYRSGSEEWGDIPFWPSRDIRPTDILVYIYPDESHYLHTPEGDFEEWLMYGYTRYTYEDVITQTDPGKIISGKNMNITADVVTNDKSNITAGNTLTANIGTLNNIEGVGRRRTVDIGLVSSFWRDYKSGTDGIGTSTTGYIPPEQFQTISVAATKFKDNTISPFTPNGSNVGLTIPNSSLYLVNTSITAKSYIETDPAYTNYKNYLSSEYYLNQLNYDPDKLAKRLGDGYYEQKLITEQIMNVTGLMYLNDYASAEEQYQALMDNAVEYAKTNNVTVGVALTAEQIANLETSIVWMVEKEVLLPTGEIVKALVPEVYVAQADVKTYPAGTAVIGAKDIDAKVTNDILNQGSIVAGDTTKISATNINNQGGTIQGSTLILDAQNDINNVGGTLIAKDEMSLTAGRDINFTTTTKSNSNAQGTITNIDQVAGAYVTGDEGSLNMSANRNVNLTAAEISNAGTGKTTVSAGKDVNLDTVETSDSNYIEWDSKNKRQDASTTEVGTAIFTNGDVNLTAGNDVNAKGAYVATEGALDVNAGNNINITASVNTNDVVEDHRHKGQTGGGNSRTQTTHVETHTAINTGSTFSGNTVNMNAGKDINIEASNVVGTEDVNLTAGNDVNIVSNTDYIKQIDEKEVKVSGIFNAGMGFTIGTQKTTDKYNSGQQIQSGSTVGSVEGNVNITAGNNVNVEASDVIAGNDIEITGKEVNIVSKDNVYNSTESHEFKQTGLTVTLSGGLVDNVNKVIAPLNRATEVKDKRLAALYTGKAVSEAVKIGGILNGTGDNPQEAKDNATSIGINIGIGTSSSSVKSESNTVVAQGSNLSAGGNVKINATEKDINVKGSNIKGENVELNAKENINIVAAENTNEAKTDGKNSSVGIGVSISLTNPASSGAYFAGSVGESKVRENSTAYTGSTVVANENLTMTSGKDTNIIGSQVGGNKVEIEVGGNLNIESLQEKEKYKESNYSASLGITTSGVTGSANTGSTKSNYESVVEQAGIYAGDEGFDIKVKGNTDLKGAVIDSTAEADKNKLTTGTLTWSDIENKAEYSSASVGGSLNTGKTIGQGGSVERKDAGLTPNIGMPSSDSDSSTTKSGIAEGTITITNPEKQVQEVNALNRNTNETLNTLGQIFDRETIAERQELAALFGELAYNQIHDMNGTNEQKAVWHALVGGIMGELSGGSFLAGATAAGINKLLTDQLEKAAGGDPALHQWLSAGLGAVIGQVAGNAQTGASTAASGTKNNNIGKEHENTKPKEIAIGIELDRLGHVSLLVGNEDGTYEEGNYGRFIVPDGTGSKGVYVFDNNVDLNKLDRNIYVLNEKYFSAGDIVMNYNAQLQGDIIPVNNNENDIVIQYIKNDSRTTKYYYSGGTNYNLFSNNCVTTTLGSITIRSSSMDSISTTFMSDIKGVNSPYGLDNILLADFLEHKGKGIVATIIPAKINGNGVKS